MTKSLLRTLVCAGLFALASSTGVRADNTLGFFVGNPDFTANYNSFKTQMGQDSVTTDAFVDWTAPIWSAGQFDQNWISSAGWIASGLKTWVDAQPAGSPQKGLIPLVSLGLVDSAHGYSGGNWNRAGALAMLNDANSAFVMMDVEPTGYVRFIYRSSAGGATSFAGVSSGVTPSTTTPVWVKLVKNGGNYSGYYATTVGTPAAADWHPYGSLYSTTLLGPNHRSGLAVCSGFSATLTTAIFSSVSL